MPIGAQDKEHPEHPIPPGTASGPGSGLWGRGSQLAMDAPTHVPNSTATAGLCDRYQEVTRLRVSH